MAEAEATILENSETITEPETKVEEPQAPEPQAPEPKRGRGRPAGAKDKAPRTTKPKVRVEPIPQPKAKPAPAPAQAVVSPELPSLSWNKGPQVQSPLPLARSSGRPPPTF